VLVENIRLHRFDQHQVDIVMVSGARFLRVRCT